MRQPATAILLAMLAMLAMLVMLGGCAGRPATVAIAPPPATPPATAAAAVPPAPTPINAGLSPAATLWHLRTGLNVAALACRGPDAARLAAAYNALLARRSAALAAAVAGDGAEYRAGGGDWRDRYDDDQTRLYNFWSRAHGRAGLCAAAGDAFAALAGASEADLPEVARAELAHLDAAFAPPRLLVDARVFDAPPSVMVAAR